MIDKIITMVTALVVIIAVSIPLMGAMTTVQGGTATNEVWTGTAGSPHTTVYNPVTSLTTNTLKTVDTKTNSTALLGANSTRTLSPLTPLTSYTFNVTIVSASVNYTISNTTVTVGSCTLGTLSSTTETWSGLSNTCLTSPMTITFHSAGVGTNITSAAAVYYYWATNTNVSVSSGELLPAVSGTFRSTYVYGSDSSANTILALLPVFFALAAIVIVGAFLMM